MATTSLEVLDPSQEHGFRRPTKEINEGHDVPNFLMSRAYKDITTFITQLNRSVVPRLVEGIESRQGQAQVWELGSPDITYSDTVKSLRDLLDRLGAMIEEAPLDTGPRRFGNVSFRKWYSIVKMRVPELLKAYIPTNVRAFGPRSSEGVSAIDELEAYFLGSFGSPERLDYGTGHELSFIAFLACLWKLGSFGQKHGGAEERGIVLGLIEPYLQLIRRLVLTYTLEPAGSHGVWGLDDHSFIPYIFGSAQFAPAISETNQIPAEGSLSDAPDPGDVTKSHVVQRERKRNMYFSAVGFIYDVKKGPFWEHSPILFDISGIRAGWAKINKGMMKMYNVEVLSKFPVVQHFPFGSLLSWERDPSATIQPSSVHTSNFPTRAAPGVDQGTAASSRVPIREATAAPRSNASGPSIAGSIGTAAPWATRSSTSMNPPKLPAATGASRAQPATQTSRTQQLFPARGVPATEMRLASGAVGRETKESDLPTRAP